MNDKRIIVLGATGSIGINCFDAVRNLGNGYRIVGASCHSRVDELLDLAREFGVAALAVSGREDSDSRITWTGPDAVRRLLEETEADIVVNGIAGSSGLMPSVWSLQTGKDLALANKETIVMAGRLIQELADRKERRVLPVDSEHSAIFHLLQNRKRSEVRKIVITASGGPFRTTPLEKFSGITLKDALRHPTWDMGAKITIDSATMANKGLEVIEAHYLFDLPSSRISVLIHPQSCIHSMIQSVDGSFYAQISNPDMRIPIQNAITFPDVNESPFGVIDFTAAAFTFEEPDPVRYPILPLAFQAVDQEGAYPLAFNAANEAAVEAFREEKIRFTDIAAVVEGSLEDDWSSSPSTFEEAVHTHRRVWERAGTRIESIQERLQ